MLNLLVDDVLVTTVDRLGSSPSETELRPQLLAKACRRRRKYALNPLKRNELLLGVFVNVTNAVSTDKRN